MSSRYQIVEEINQGGVGIVFKAWDTRLQRHVAIKRFLSAEQRADAGDIENDLLREAAVLSALQHPNIVSIHDVELDPDHGPCVVMEYLNGKDLEQAVTGAALTVEDFYKVAEQTLDALSSAHRMNLLHRDIKPSNIQVTWLANGKFVSKFVDFGLARFFEKPSRQTVRQDGTVMGSIFYMSPEQLERQPLDQRSDLYSLGCVFYFILSMHRPFEGPTVQDVITSHLTGRCAPLREYRPNLAPALCRWVEWLIRRNADDRAQDAELALSVLRQIIRGQAVKIPSNSRAVEDVGTRELVGRIAPPTAAPVPSPAARSRYRKGPVKKKTGIPWPVYAAAAVVVLGSAVGVWKWRTSAAPVQEIALSAADLIREGREAGTAALTGSRPPVASRLPHPADVAAIVSTPRTGGDAEKAPPSAGLVLWFDAGIDTGEDAAGKPTAPRGPVCRWVDQTDLGGRTELQYHTTGTREPQQSWPTLGTAGPPNGLAATFPVLRFQDDNLVIRDADQSGPALGSVLDKSGITVLIVFRSPAANGPRALLSARDSRRQRIWSVSLDGDSLVAAAGENPATSTPVTLGGNHFEIASVTFDFPAGKCQRQLLNAAGEKSAAESRFPAMPTVTPLAILRLGREDADGKTLTPPFTGEIAELLIYHSALPDKSRLSAEQYLSMKYFGDHASSLAAEN